MKLGKLKSATYSILDQILLSGIALSFSFLLLRFGSKQDFGVYTLVMTLIALFSSVSNAAIAGPAMTIASLFPNKRAQIIYLSNRILFRSLVIGMVGMACVLTLLSFGSSDLEISKKLLAFSCLAVAGVLARDGSRFLNYIDLKPGKAVSQDIVYVSMALVGLFILFVKNYISVVNVFGVMAVASLIAYVLFFDFTKKTITEFNWLSNYWPYGKWALAGVVVTWFTLSSYPLFSEKFLGIEATADLGAARLFFLPAAISTTAWLNIMRPRLLNYTNCGDGHIATLIKKYSILGFTIVFTLMLVALNIFYSQLQIFLGSKYQGLQGICNAWGVYFYLSAIRTVVSSTALTSENGYILLVKIGFSSLIFVSLYLAFFSKYGGVWIIIGLCVAEIIYILLIKLNDYRQNKNAFKHC